MFPGVRASLPHQDPHRRGTMPRSTRSYDDRIAQLRARQEVLNARRPVGHPSQGFYVMMACDIAMSQYTGQLTINQAVKATTEVLRHSQFFQKLSHEEFSMPVTNTIRKHVKFFLKYRRGLSPQD